MSMAGRRSCSYTTTSSGPALWTCTTKAGGADWRSSEPSCNQRRALMPRAEKEITIARPPEAVFEFLADPENDTQWRSGVLDLERISGAGVGARYAQGVKGPGGRRIAADIEITEFEPGRAIAFQTTSGPVRPHGRYLLSPADG